MLLPKGSRQDQPDLEKYVDATDDELEAMLRGDKPDIAAEPEEEDPVDEPEEKIEEEPADEPTDDPDPEEDEGEEEEAETSMEDRMALLEKRLELESLRREKETAARERAELLASKNAGKAGHYKQQLEAASGNADTATEDDPWAGLDRAEEQGEERKEQSPYRDPDDHKELVANAINDEGNKFAAEKAGELDELPQEFIARMGEIISEESVPYREAMLTGNIRAARKIAATIYRSAYATAKIEFSDTLTANAVTRKAESVKKSKRMKKKAAISKSGSGPQAKGRAKSYDNMDETELEAEFEKEFGANYKQSRNTLS